MNSNRFSLALGLLLLVLTGCTRQDSLERVLASGELVVVSRNSPTTYYLDKTGRTGFEYALVSLLAKDLGVTLTLEPAFTMAEIFERLQREEVDLAAAGLTLTGPREAAYPHTGSYYKLKAQVVYVAGQRRPRSVDDMPGRRIAVLAGSSHAESLRILQQNGLPNLQWQEIHEADSMELLERVNSGEVELALVDSNEFSLQQSLYPRLKVGFDLGSEQDLVWYLPPSGNHDRLLTHINAFIQRLHDSGALARLREEHFGHTTGISRISSHTFTRNMHKSLPRYRQLIEQVAAEYQLDWHLLAAVAYQESHWNPLAESPTGVRGMMMLTRPTARELGVDNRLDVTQSLRGGARYLKDIRRRLPDDIYEPDRTWLALAAYNIGMGHLEDARVITDRQGGDPHLWQDVMERLPLLQKRQFFETTRYGYARGVEAATYVQNIRHYYSILQWQDIASNKPLPPIQADDHVPFAIRALRLPAL